MNTLLKNKPLATQPIKLTRFILGGFMGLIISMPSYALNITKCSDFPTVPGYASGNGSPSSPYLIDSANFSSTSGDALAIDGTNLNCSFTLNNLTINNSAIHGLVLKDINVSGNPSGTTNIVQVTGANTTLNKNLIGIAILNSNNVTLCGNALDSKGNCIVSKSVGVPNANAGSINQNTIGAIDVENSSNIKVQGWQLSANGVNGTPEWLHFQYDDLSNVSRSTVSSLIWGVGGVRFVNVNNSLIDHNASNNDTSISVSLFNSSNNTITSNAFNYPFSANFLLVGNATPSTSAPGSACVGSCKATGNKFEYNQMSTADYIGILVANPYPVNNPQAYSVTTSPTNNNAICYNTLGSNGPTGNEFQAATPPSFVGAIILLNGTTSNTVAYNTLQQNKASGFDLDWAEGSPYSGVNSTGDVASYISPSGAVVFAPCNDPSITSGVLGLGPNNSNNAWFSNTYNKSNLSNCPSLPTAPTNSSLNSGC